MTKLSADKILDYLNSAILCLDGELNLCRLNATAEEMFSSSRRLLKGRNLRELFLPGETDSILEALDACVEHHHAVSSYESRLLLSNGLQVMADYSITPIQDPEIPFRVIIEIQVLDRHIQITRDDYRLSQKQASYQLARGIAHEIKNPLGGIRGAAQLLVMESGDDKFKEYTDVIIKEVDRLQDLVNNMLGPNREMRKEPINIFAVLEHICSLILVEASKGLTIRRDYDPSIPLFNGDRNQLIQAFLNIMRNAVQAVDEAGEITLKTRVTRQYTIANQKYPLVMIVEVIDDGPGMDQAMMDNIFLPMVTTKADGSGLGLPIAQQIITRHGGIIQCHNAMPHGAVFTTVLPLEHQVQA